MLDELDKRISALENVLDAVIEQQGYNYNQFAILYTLGSSVDGSCTQKQICEQWWIPKQTVYNICKEFKNKGLITFSENATDKRAKQLMLTELGRPYAEKVVKTTKRFSETVLKKFGPSKAARLYTLLTELTEICKQEKDVT